MSAKAGLCSMGIEGLNGILNGGLPENHFYLIQGDPGVGKTTLALQFLLEGVRAGEKVFYISLSESKKELEAIAASHGWSLDKFAIVELSAIEQQIKIESQNTVFHPSEIELNQMTAILLAEIEKVKPTRIVFDSLSEIRNLAQNPMRYRRQMLALKSYFLNFGATVLLLDDRSSERTDLHVETLAYGVLTLEMSTPGFGAARRKLKIVKLRGHRFVEGYHDFLIRKGGIELFPRMIAASSYKNAKISPVSAGIPEFDTLAGGGLDRGTSSLFMGPAGSGKSSLATQFAYAAAKRGEKVLVYVFEETLEGYLHRSKSISLDLHPFCEKGLIKIIHVDPAELTSGELTHQIRKAVEQEKISTLVIDSINGYLQAMPDERHLTLQLHELLTYLNQMGILSILTLAQHGMLDHMQSPLDVTYVADTVILFRYFEFQGKIKKAVSIVKKRSGAHENSIREYKITSKGVQVGEPLENFTGVLTGVPVYQGPGKSIMT